MEETSGKKTAAVAMLTDAVRELESGAGLSALTGGHGLQSRTFEFSWESPNLAISFAMPYERFYSDEDERAEDEAAIGAACRLAILLIEADAAGSLLCPGESSVSVSFDKLAGRHYSVLTEDGTAVDSGDDWDGLVTRLKHIFTPQDCERLSIIWP